MKIIAINVYILVGLRILDYINLHFYEHKPMKIDAFNESKLCVW